MRRAIATIVALCVVAAQGCAPPVYAQGPPNCIPYALVTDALKKRHGEVRIGRGLTEGGGGATVEIWAHPDGKTWTIFIVSPDGALACPAAVGVDYKAEPLGRTM